MMKSELLNKLDEIEKYAQASKFYRFFHSPIRYLKGITISKAIYPITKNGYLTNAITFWNQSMSVRLPAAMDIYLSGGKTHASEIRLSRYLVNTIEHDTIFLDIGAHIGFFSLLVAQLAPNGKIISVEPSPQTFQLLQNNTRTNHAIFCKNIALSDSNEIIEFLEFPVLYSEYNTIEKNVYQNEHWFKNIQANTISISAQMGSLFLTELSLHPSIIKIDVEGAEEKVIKGLSDYLKQYYPKIIMEFANASRQNTNHNRAEAILFSLGYKAYSISSEGYPKAIETSTEAYIATQQVESDNIIYLKD